MARQKWGESGKGRTASETVYDILHRNIINLNLTPGTPMSEKEISEKMSVSRTPVREAFIKLSNEALVDIVPQKGSFVSKINLSRVKEERFLRESLETSVIEELISRDAPVPLKNLYENLERQKEALDNKSHTDFIELDDQFHAMLFDLAEKSMCYQLIMSFSSHYRRVRYLSMSVSGVSMSNYKQHIQLLEALEKRTVDFASETMKNHLQKLNIEKEEICNKFPEYFEDENSGGIGRIDERALFS